MQLRAFICNIAHNLREEKGMPKMPKEARRANKLNENHYKELAVKEVSNGLVLWWEVRKNDMEVSKGS